MARQLLPPIIAEAIRRVVDRRRSSGKPEWEYRKSGWPDDDNTIRGWDVESVPLAHLARWPAFIESIQSGTPFGLSNDADAPTEVDYGRHNTVMCFAYVLARTANGRRQVSMLDWGGGIGQYGVYARAVLPEVELEYHCRDLPLLTAAGRQVLPLAHFHDSEDDALSRTYDLVLASGSLHYSSDWRGILARLARAADRYLYVTRQPTVDRAPSFVVVQRPYRHGYETEYAGWVLNRHEFLEEARSVGLELVREFLIAERLIVPGAPEQANFRGFLFAASPGQMTV